MRSHLLLALLPLASALVITEQTFFEKFHKSGKKFLDKSQSVLDDAFGKASETFKQAGDEAYHKIHQTGCAIDSWLEGFSAEEDLDHPPHHGPKDPHHRPPHHRKPHHPPNETVYQLIAKSKYTTKLAKLIDEFPDIVDKLNGTEANYTIFAPTDSAFDKIPKHGKKPPKEFLEKVLLYHVSDEFFPAGRVLRTYTIPTLYEPDLLGHKQRLTVRVTGKGPAINFYSRLIATNIFGTNGVIHGIDSILVPPPSVATILDILPGEFSTLDLGLRKTGLYEKMNGTKHPHEGGTFFAPSNFAFKKLGPRINAFLFSDFGTKYLNALLKYHIVVNQTVYTDAFYLDDDAKSDSNEARSASRPPYFHFDLETALGKPIAVDVTKYGPFISIKLNAFSRVTVHDGIASDGVIQVVSDVLLPPKNKVAEDSFWAGEEMSVEEFMERLEPFIVEEDIGEEDGLEL